MKTTYNETRPADGNGKACPDWDIKFNLTIVYHDSDMEEMTNGCLYTEGQYGYYERIHIICSDRYATTYRFGRDRMSDVFLFLANNPPQTLEKHIKSFDGCEIVFQEQY